MSKIEFKYHKQFHDGHYRACTYSRYGEFLKLVLKKDAKSDGNRTAIYLNNKYGVTIWAKRDSLFWWEE